MKNRHRRLLVITVLVLYLAFSAAAPAMAIAGTIYVKSNPTYYFANPMPRQIYVYGPNGYYRSARDTRTGFQAFTVGFTGAPNGPYRVRVIHEGLYERNWYGWLTFTWWNWWPKTVNMWP